MREKRGESHQENSRQRAPIGPERHGDDDVPLGLESRDDEVDLDEDAADAQLGRQREHRRDAVDVQRGLDAVQVDVQDRARDGRRQVQTQPAARSRRNRGALHEDTRVESWKQQRALRVLTMLMSPYTPPVSTRPSVLESSMLAYSVALELWKPGPSINRRQWQRGRRHGTDLIGTEAETMARNTRVGAHVKLTPMRTCQPADAQLSGRSRPKAEQRK
mgnify:CR=1 FL=1